MGCHTLIEFILISICYLSAVWQHVAWRQRKNVFAAVHFGARSGGPIHSESPGAWFFWTAHVLLASAFSKIMHKYAYLVPQQQRFPSTAAIPAPLLAALSFTLCNGVIVRGVDAPASAKGTSVNLCWVWATPSSLLIWPGLVAMVSVFCHNVSSPCCGTLWMKSFIFLFISGL